MTKPIGTMPIDIFARIGDGDPVKITTVDLPLEFDATDKGIRLKPVDIAKSFREAFADIGEEEADHE